MPTQPTANANIGAQAFRFMEMAPFSSFADDTPQAQDAADQYPVARHMCLEACDWSFASKVAALPEADTGAIIDPALAHSYSLPGDCLRMLHTLDRYVRWRIDGNILRADRSGPLPIRYTADVQDDQRMTAAFQTALALRLAALLSPRWVGADSKTNALEQRADLALRQAMKLDGRSASIERYDGEEPGVTDWAGWATR